jgi:hypothetical protein
MHIVLCAVIYKQLSSYLGKFIAIPVREGGQKEEHQAEIKP